MTVVRVIIVDDELLARKRLARLLGAMPKVEVVASCDSPESLARALEAHQADAVLLDIHMPGLNGLDAAALLPDPAPAVIFVTAHGDHALDAFDLGAVDYVLKPVDPARLRRAINRIRPDRSSPRLSIPTRDGMVLVDPATIRHVSFDGTLVTIHCPEGAVLTERTLTDLEADLPPGFERVHRRHLIARTHIQRLVRTSSGATLAITTDGDEVPVSRAAARRLRRQLS